MYAGLLYLWLCPRGDAMTHPETPQGTQVDVEALRDAAKAASNLWPLPEPNSDDHGGVYYECPICNGEGSVEQCLTIESAKWVGGVQVYGIGDEHLTAEKYLRVANPSAILALLAAKEAAEAELADYKQIAEHLGEQGHRFATKLEASEKRAGEYQAALKRIRSLSMNTQNMPPEFAKVIEDNFWDLFEAQSPTQALADPQHGGGEA
jgi:hypothetical protein